MSVSRLKQIRREKGIKVAIMRSIRYLVSQAIWTIRRSYTLSISDSKISFDGLNREARLRNKSRFKREKKNIQSVLSRVSEDDVVFDIGANTGLYTCFLAPHARKVVAFEPMGENVTQLQRNVNRNGLENVEIISVALSDRCGTTNFARPETEMPGYGRASLGSGDGSDTTVETRRGDQLVKDNAMNVPNVVKIDVEGAEPLVIDGMCETLQNENCRVLNCEIHLGESGGPSIHDFGSSFDELKNKIKSLGFDITDENRESNVVQITAEK